MLMDSLLSDYSISSFTASSVSRGELKGPDYLRERAVSLLLLRPRLLDEVPESTEVLSLPPFFLMADFGCSFLRMVEPRRLLGPFAPLTELGPVSYLTTRLPLFTLMFSVIDWFSPSMRTLSEVPGGFSIISSS